MQTSPREWKRATRKRLRSLVHGKNAFDLMEAALVVAAEEYPALDVDAERERVRAMGREGARRTEGLDNIFARLDALRSFLFDEMRFRGNFDDYDDPRNSYMNQVLGRRTGVPLTLCVLFCEIARHCAFDARPIALPGHMVARLGWDGREILVDPYHGGQVITREDCRSLVGRATSRPSLFEIDQLRGACDREVLYRMLRNLKRIYLRREDHLRALAAVERLLLLIPQEPSEVRDRGILLAHLGQASAAVANLEAYLTLDPAAPDAASVRGRLAWLRRRLSQAP